MCRGEDQELFDLLIMPWSSIALNSFLAASNFSGSKRRYREEMGLWHVVSITCLTPCFTGGNVFAMFTTVGNSAATPVSSSPTPAASSTTPSLSPVPLPTAEEVGVEPDEDEGGVVELLEGEDDGGVLHDSSAATTPIGAALQPAGGAAKGTGWRPGRYSRRRRKSTHKSKCSKKSAPSIGNATAAKRKFQLKWLPAACSVRLKLPQHLMGVRSAAIIVGPLAGLVEECGISEKADPVSTKNHSLVASSTRSRRRPG